MPSSTMSTPYGYRTAVSAPFPPDEARAWFEDVKRAVSTARPGFGQLVDIRGQRPQSDETNRIIEDAMSYVINQGLQRSAVILDSAVTRLNMIRLAKEAGMYAYERYFDASSDPDWERKALDWIERGIDPDQP